jgi:hypothetical protein
MKNFTRSSLLAFAVAVLAPLAAASDRDLACDTAGWVPRSAFELGADLTKPALPQIQAHLERVVDELRARDVSHLSPELRVRRGEHLARLAVYAEAGIFPVNTHSPVPSPVFIDDAGRACAVGYLMIESGARELAEQIAANELLGYLPDLRTGGVEEWVAASGLTAEECALIQPSYTYCQFWGELESTSSCHQTLQNSAGLPSSLMACGSGLASGVTFFVAEPLPKEPTVIILLVAPLTGLVRNPGGSAGMLCLGGPIVRHPSLVTVSGPDWLNSGDQHVATWVLDNTQLPQPGGLAPIHPGEIWHFQAWYRDGGTSHLTNMVSIAFQ